MQVGPYTLRDCQIDSIHKLRSAIGKMIQAGVPPHAILQAPCGFGKTLVSTMIMELLSAGMKAAFIVHGRQLIIQKSQKLTECGIYHSVVMANIYSELDGQYAREYSEFNQEAYHNIFVCSKDTVESRDISLEELGVDIIIVDECHLGMSSKWIEIIGIKKPVIGFSASPAKGKGGGLGDFYNDIVVGSTYSELIRDGYLVPAKVCIPEVVELKRKNGEKVEVSNNGEYNSKQVDEVFNESGIIGDVVKTWREHGENRATVVFCSSVDHSIAMTSAFNTAGVSAEHVEADTTSKERAEIYSRLKSGETKVICNVRVLVTGVDFPIVECIVLAVSINSVVNYVQAVGRGLRPYTDPDTGRVKKDCLVIDHGGNFCTADGFEKHGLPHDDREWSLDPDVIVSRLDSETKKPIDEPKKVAVCPKCKMEKGGQKKCPGCGYEYIKSGVMVRMADAKFVEADPKKLKKKKKEASDAQKIWHSCLGIAANKNYSYAQANAMFRQRHSGSLPKEVYPQADIHQYRMKVAVLFPGYCHKKKKAKV